MLIGKPVIIVSFKCVFASVPYPSQCSRVTLHSYRLGLLGFAASLALREDNKAAGDEGVGNYGTSTCPTVINVNPGLTSLQASVISGERSNGSTASFRPLAATPLTLPSSASRPAQLTSYATFTPLLMRSSPYSNVPSSRARSWTSRSPQYMLRAHSYQD